MRRVRTDCLNVQQHPDVVQATLDIQNFFDNESEVKIVVALTVE